VNKLIKGNLALAAEPFGDQAGTEDRAPAEVRRADRPQVVAVHDLAMRYGDGEPVIEDVSLEVREGEVVSLVGPSGSGKSTILRAMSGLHPPMAGSVDLAVPPTEVGFLFQDDALLPWRTARDNVALGLRLHGRPTGRAREEAAQWMARLGLKGLESRYPRQLSGGQRKRVALAQVLALRPRLLLMDEPFASLDAIVRHRVTQDLLRWVEGEGIAVLLVTHDLEEAQALSDLVYLLSQGPRARISHRYPVEIPRPRDLIAVRGHPNFAPLLQRIWKDLSVAVEEAEARQ
jgi:NitT/TauT family transport system ATP-binding protein